MALVALADVLGYAVLSEPEVILVGGIEDSAASSFSAFPLYAAGTAVAAAYGSSLVPDSDVVHYIRTNLKRPAIADVQPPAKQRATVNTVAARRRQPPRPTPFLGRWQLNDQRRRRGDRRRKR